MKEELNMPNNVNFVTGLPFGEGQIGKLNDLTSPEDIYDFGKALQQCTVPITHPFTADCVDGRKTIALGDGTTDPDVLEKRVVQQYPGGFYLPVTKAASAADLAILRDAKDVTEAYLIITDIMNALGYQDGGHPVCGASTLVKQSVESDISGDALELSLPVLVSVDQASPRYIDMNNATKLRHLENGYYDSWDNGWHEEHLAKTVPQNFSILETDPNDLITHGHRERAAYTIVSPGFGLAKNEFIQMTGGQQSFATTVKSADAMIDRVIRQIGGSNEERLRMRLEMGIDTAQVLNKLVAKGLPVFSNELANVA